jgi:triosephosphate isomerase
MNLTLGQAGELARGVAERLAGFDRVEAVLCPPFTALQTVAQAIDGSKIKLGGQDAHWELDGAFTGAISIAMLQDLGCDYVIIGHSERRSYFHETDESVRRKTEAVLSAGLRAIVCVGETLGQREADRTEDVLRAQIDDGLAGIGEGLRDVVIAYEPVWAIGTGKTATVKQAQSAHAFIRGRIAETVGEGIAAGMRIQYGGSVKPSNARELFGQTDVDGGLIGGASLDAASFDEIVRAAGIS